MKKAIIIGATSGIGRALSILLAQNGYMIAATGRRLHLLRQLQAEIGLQVLVKEIDLINFESAIAALGNLLGEMGSVDLIVICAGTGFVDPALPWEKEKTTIDVNVLGFTAMANVAYHYFLQRKTGHLVAISSVAAIRGGGAPAYNASKAFIGNYLQGIRYLYAKQKLPINVTEIIPGFVATEMAKGEGLFWVATPEKAANKFYTAIRKKKKYAYITKRWKLVAWVVRLMPEKLYCKL